MLLLMQFYMPAVASRFTAIHYHSQTAHNGNINGNLDKTSRKLDTSEAIIMSNV